jgi:hypothetical protein
MMDHLLSRSSHGAFVAYFQSLAPHAGFSDMDDNFQAAFRMTIPEFQWRLDAYFAGVMR